MLGIDKRLHAKAAADIAGDDAHLALVLAHNPVHQLVEHEVHALAAGMEIDAAGGGIPFGDGVARLHRYGGDSVVDQVDFGDVVRLCKCLVGGRSVAVDPVEDDVAGDMIVQLRRPGPGGGDAVDDRGQRPIVDSDGLSGVFGLLQRLCNNEGDRFADIADLPPRQHRARCIMARRAILVFQRHKARNIADTRRGKVLVDVDCVHARHLAGIMNGKRVHRRVGYRRAQHIAIQAIGRAHIVRIPALACG